jgi:hypothetical protein
MDRRLLPELNCLPSKNELLSAKEHGMVTGANAIESASFHEALAHRSACTHRPVWPSCLSKLSAAR